MYLFMPQKDYFKNKNKEIDQFIQAAFVIGWKCKYLNAMTSVVILLA